MAARVSARASKSRAVGRSQRSQPLLASGRYQRLETHQVRATDAWRCIAQSIPRCPAGPAIARPLPPDPDRRQRCADPRPPLPRPPEVMRHGSAACRASLRRRPPEWPDRETRGSTRRLDRAISRQAGHQRASQADPARYRDLLSQHGPYREFKPIPSARHPQLRSRSDQRREGRVLDQLQCDRVRIRRQVEHPAQAPDNLRQGGQFRELNSRAQRITGNRSNGHSSGTRPNRSSADRPRPRRSQPRQSLGLGGSRALRASRRADDSVASR